MAKLSKQYEHISGRMIAERIQAGKPIIAMDEADVPNYEALIDVGIGFANSYLKNAPTAWAMDDVNGGVFTSAAVTPVQFLQTFLPGFVNAAFAPRKADELMGITTIGQWHDEEIVQGTLETLGEAVPYADNTVIPFSDFNAGFETRSVVRFEQGLKVGRLEAARTAQMRLDAASRKRTAAMLSLEFMRNRVAFNGFNNGTNRTYGFLNDPSLPAYVTVAQGAANATTWDKKTFLEITADIRAAFAQLQIQSNGAVEPEQTDTVLALPTGVSAYLSVTSDYGNSVRQWLTETYPRCRIVTAPNLNKANGGSNVFYLYAEELLDGSDDDGRVWIQAVPNKFMALGVENNSKAVIEDYTNATAGVILKRPYAVYRGTGI